MNLKEKKLNSSVKYDGKILRLEVDEVELPDGRYSERECVRHSGGAAVLFVKDNKIALVKQFRYLYGEEIYEIPAGKLNVGEDPLNAASRELKEETGYSADYIAFLLDIYPSPGYTDEVIHIYFTDCAHFTGQNLDEGEFLDVEFIEVGEVKRMIDEGIIKDSKTISAVYKYLLNK